MSKINPHQNIIEIIFENLLWKGRLGTIIAVIFSALGSLGMFIIGSLEIIHAFQKVNFLAFEPKTTEKVLIGIIGAMDLYLIGIILLIFSFGVYELFISKIDPAHREGRDNILNITSLDELKNKILKVIIMVLIVSFSKAILSMEFTSPAEMLYFAIGILAVSASVFLIHKKDNES